MTDEVVEKGMSEAIGIMATAQIELSRLVGKVNGFEKRDEARRRLNAISYQMTALSNLLLNARICLPPMESKDVEQVEIWVRSS